MRRGRAARTSDFLFGEEVDLDSGLVIERSTSKFLQNLGQWGLFLVAGLALLVGSGFGIAAALGFFKNTSNPIVVWIMSILGVLAGLAIAAFGALALWAEVSLFRRKERIIVGKKYLQRVFDEATANLQVPFDNIEDLRIEAQRDGDAVTEFIGINIANLKRSDTIVDRDRVKVDRKNLSADVAIFDVYQKPLDELFEKLVARWRKVRDSENDDCDASLRAFRKQHKVRSAVSKVVGLFLLGLVILCVVLGGALWLRKTLTDQGPAGAVAPGGAVGFDKALADLGSNDIFVSRKAGDSLAKMQPNDAQRPLVTQKLAGLINHQDVFTRQAVFKALGVWATPNDVPVLIQGLQDANPFVRQEAIKAVAPFKDERSLTPLVKCFEDHPTRDEAEKALRLLGPKAEKALLPLLESKEVFLARATAWLLKDIGTEQSVPALEAAAAGPHPPVAAAARAALTAIAARAKK